MTSKRTNMTAAQRKAQTVKRTAGSAFYVAAAATVAANVYASQHTWIGAAVGLWTPVAFFVSLELLERVPAGGRAGQVRLVAIAVLSAIAGWTSYWHLVSVLDSAGVHDPVGLYGGPLTVDGLMVIARMAMHHKVPSRPAVRRPAAKTAPVKLRSVKAS